MGIKFSIQILVFLVCGLAAASSKKNYSLVLDYYEVENNCKIVEENFYFCGNNEQEQRVLSWMQDISQTSVGRETLFAIKKSQHRMLIMHSAHSVGTAGRTLAPLTKNLENGVGVDVVVQMHLDMPESGTHLVTDSHNKLIPFTARINFFHELSHARHKMNGTLWLIQAEEQAVAEENIYRQESDGLLGITNTPLRDLYYTDNDQRVWFP